MKQITITVPDNCELKQDGNTYTIVEKEEKKLTYEDIAKELFSFSKHCFCINTNGEIVSGVNLSVSVTDLNNCVSKKQAEKLLAINKLMNVAKYLNGDWQPDWKSTNELKYAIGYDYKDNRVIFDITSISCNWGIVYFKSVELAKQAIKILGKDTIKLALCTDY